MYSGFNEGDGMDKHFRKVNQLENGVYICDMCLDVDKKSDVQAVYASKKKHAKFRGNKFAFPRPVYLCEECYNYLRALVKD